MKALILTLLIVWGYAQPPQSTPQGITSYAPSFSVEPRHQGAHKFITAKELHNLLQNKQPIILIDVSKKGHFLIEHIPDAKHLEPRTSQQWEENIKNTKELQDKLGADTDIQIIFYDEGNIPPSQTSPADIAYNWAEKLGYKNLYRLAGGMKIWKENHFATTSEMPKCCH